MQYSDPHYDDIDRAVAAERKRWADEAQTVMDMQGAQIENLTAALEKIAAHNPVVYPEPNKVDYFCQRTAKEALNSQSE